MGKILWLASYPKSGNTWTRVFLENYCRPGLQAAAINSLEIMNASYRSYTDDLLGVETSNLTVDEIAQYRAQGLVFLAQQPSKNLILKVHDAFDAVPGGNALFAPQASRGAVYVLRNPLDVAVSYAAYLNEDLNQVIQSMASEKRALAYRTSRLYEQLQQQLRSWSQHVLSWMDQTLIPVRLVRYEDLFFHPAEAFAEVVRFAGLPESPERLQTAIEASSFSTLQKQEQENGFRERPLGAPAFFRKGQVGSWRGVLNDEQRDQIVRDHHEVMLRFGYLTGEGELVY